MAIKQLIKEVYANMAGRNNKRVPLAKKYVMSEYDTNLLDRLIDFRSLSHSLNPEEHETQVRLVHIWTAVINQLNPIECRALAEGWSWYNKTDDASKIDVTVDRIISRVAAGNIY